MIQKAIRLIDRLHWLWLGLASPFFLFPSAKRSLVLLIIPTIWVLHGVLVRSEKRNPKLNSEIVVRKRQTWFPITSLNLSMLLLAVMVLVSLWTTYDLSVSLGKIAGVIFGFGVYFCVVRLSATQRSFWYSLGVFLCIGLGISGLGLLGTKWFTTKITVFNPILTRLPSVVRGLQGAESGFHPNEVAGTIIWAVPLFLSLLVVFILRFRILTTVLSKGRVILLSFLFLIAGLFMVVVLILTQSRGAYIGFVLTLLLITLAALPRKWRWVYVIGLILLLVVMSILLSSHWKDVQGWFSNDGTVGNSAFSVTSLQSRVVIWSNAIKGIQDFSFTGMGLNNFRTLNHLLYPNPEIPTEFDLGHAHNEFFQAGVELGIPGMIAFSSLYIGAFWMLVRTWKNTFKKNTFNLKQIQKNTHPTVKEELGILAIGPLTRSIVLGLGGGLLAHLLYGLVDAVALGAKPGFIFWMLFGLITGLFSLSQKSTSQSAQTSETLSG